ncbi:MAG: DinB family protein [bacterium]|nr:DinB family protein [bacterium]
MAELVDYFRRMSRNNLWSNHRLHQACARLSSTVYFRNCGAFFQSIHGTLNHILVVDQFYLAALRGDAPTGGRLDEQPCVDLRTLVAIQSTSDRALLAFCDSLTDKSLVLVVRWTDTKGLTCADPIHIVLAHLFLHQIHHRGQVHNMLSVAGDRPPQFDEFLLSCDGPLRDAEVRALGLEE